MSLIFLTIIAAVIAQILGWAWHGPLLGKQYAMALGMHMPPEKKMTLRDMGWQLGLNFIANLAMAFVLFNLLGAFGAFAVGSAIRTTAILFIGFFLPMTVIGTIWNGRSVSSQKMTFAISFGYQVVLLIIWSILFALLA